MVNNLKARLRKSRGQLTPEQAMWLSRGFLFLACASLCRAAQTLWPSMAIPMIGMATFAAATVCYANLVRYSPSLQGIKRWAIPLVTGAFLNYTVMIANAGFMPAARAETVSGMYCPIHGANLVYLSDWLWGFVSPGDVLMIVAFVGIVATLIRKQEHKLVEQV